MAVSPTTIVTWRCWYPRPASTRPQVVEDVTFTTQIAPTILDALDLDPRSLQAVREEGVQVLK